MARVDAIVQQQRAGQINLECGLVVTTFQHYCDVVRKKRSSKEALEEAATVASYAALEKRCPNPGACNCEDNEEAICAAQKFVSESDEDIEAAEAYIAAEDAILAHDIAMGEEVAESLALEDWFCFHEAEYTSDVGDCSCEGRFGLNDDGEVIHCHYNY